MESSDDTTSVIPVKVAVRVRPFDEREKEENAQQCLQYYVKQNQVSIRTLLLYFFLCHFFLQLMISDRAFTFDFVFDPLSTQDAVYESCAAPLIGKLFKGLTRCNIF